MPLIKCFECGKEISDKALSCPHCGVPLSAKIDDTKANTTISDQPKEETQSNMEIQKTEPFMLYFTGFLILILIVLWMRACSGGGDATSEKVVTPDNFNVHFIAKETIKTILKDPQDAEFPPITDIQITDLGNGTWTVLGYVDGKNGFGATQRVKYKVEMHAKEQCADYNTFQCWDDVKPYME